MPARATSQRGFNIWLKVSGAGGEPLNATGFSVRLPDKRRLPPAYLQAGKQILKGEKMQPRTFIRSFLIALVGLFLMTTGIALAQERQSHTLSLTGLAPGQTLRLTVINNQPRTKPAAFARIVARNARGVLIAQTEEITVLAGDSRPFNFNLDELRSSGEPGVSLGFELQVAFNGGDQAEANRSLQLSADLVDHSTGKVVALFPRASMSEPPPCFSHCTHLFCLVYCLRPFTIYVLPTPSN